MKTMFTLKLRPLILLPSILIPALVFLAGCATTEPSAPFPAGLQGMIYDNANNPVSGALLTLHLPPEPLHPEKAEAVETGETESLPVPPVSKSDSEPGPGEIYLSSDIEGRFLLPDLMPGEYSLAISCEGFEPEEVSVRFSDPGQVLYVKMTSLNYLRRQIEEVLKRRDFEAAENLFARADGIEEKDPILLFLKASHAALGKEWAEAEGYIIILKEAGFSSEGLSKLEHLVASNREEIRPEEENHEAE